MAIDEILQTSEKEVLFRGNSIITKALEYYQKLSAHAWLATIIPVINEIVEDDFNCEVPIPAR